MILPAAHLTCADLELALDEPERVLRERGIVHFGVVTAPPVRMAIGIR